MKPAAPPARRGTTRLGSSVSSRLLWFDLTGILRAEEIAQLLEARD